MKNVGAFIVFAIATQYASGASLLTAQKFPKTASDLTFAQRMELLSDGYSAFESDYDPVTGKCLTNCAYSGITLAQELKDLEDASAKTRADLRDDGIDIPEPSDMVSPTPEPPDAVTPQPVQPVPTPTLTPVVTPTPAPTPTPVQTITAPVARYNCTNNNSYNSDTKPDSDVPVNANPLPGKSLQVTSPFGWRPGGTHRGIDFGVPTGTPVYATASGTVITVGYESDGCGNYIEVQHGTRYKTQYCHLSKQTVKRGDKISAGCQIGLSGNSGRSSGPHLHYRIDDLSQKMPVDPAPFLRTGTWRCTSDVASRDNCKKWKSNQAK